MAPPRMAPPHDATMHTSLGHAHYGIRGPPRLQGMRVTQPQRSTPRTARHETQDKQHDEHQALRPPSTETHSTAQSQMRRRDSARAAHQQHTRSHDRTQLDTALRPPLAPPTMAPSMHSPDGAAQQCSPERPAPQDRAQQTSRPTKPACDQPYRHTVPPNPARPPVSPTLQPREPSS